jgi:glycosyltransferase involved in cell wall biosynthesis
MTPIRILVDSLADKDGFNAQMTSARDIMSRLDPTRFHVTTFCIGQADVRLLQRPATHLIQLPRRRQTLRILAQFVGGDHDILFYVKSSPAARMYLSLRPKWLDTRIVIGTVESQSDVRNEPTIKPESIHLWERTILRSDYLFSNSASVRESLKKEYGLPSEVVPTGVDTKFFTPVPDRPPNSRVRVLFVGSLRPFKGPQLLLRAAPRFSAADFMIVGDGVMAAELEERVRREKLTNVQFARGLDVCALREQYRAADIFLFPSHWEGSPKVISEAAACGLPVIARADYEPETVINGQTGYLGQSDDELLAHLEKLIASLDLRKTMARASRSHIEKFDWDPITRRWEEIFVRLAPKKSTVESR